MEKHLQVCMPDGTHHDFGQEKAAIVESMPTRVERDTAVYAMTVAEMATRVGAGKVGELPRPLNYKVLET